MILLTLLACATSTPETAPIESKAPTAKTSTWKHYGTPFKVASTLPAKTVIEAPEKRVNQQIRVTGPIDKVCRKAGCWMVVTDGEGQTLRVIMKDHAFGVPTDTEVGPNTKADIEGTLVAHTLDEKTKAHLRSEADGIPEENTKTFDQRYELVATGIAIQAG